MNNSQIKTASCFLYVYLIQNITQVPSNFFVLTFQDTLHDKPIRSCHHAATDNVVACHHQRRRRPQPLGRATVGLTEVGHAGAGNISDHVHLGSPESAMLLPTMSLARLNTVACYRWGHPSRSCHHRPWPLGLGHTATGLTQVGHTTMPTKCACRFLRD